MGRKPRKSSKRSNPSALLEALENRRLLSAATVTTLALSTNSSLTGQNVTYTATVSPTTSDGVPLTGTVQFFDGSSLLEKAPVDADGDASIVLDNLFTGTHSITAKFKGDSTLFAASTSTAQTLSITPGPVMEGTGIDTGLKEYNVDSGTGPAAVAGDFVEVEYTGYLNDGTQFQGGNALAAGGSPFDLELVAPGAQGQSIGGFNDGIIGMTTGQTRLVSFRSGLGYGTGGQGSIGASSKLNFILTVLGIQSSNAVPNLYVIGPTGFPVFSNAAVSGINGTDFGAITTNSSVTATFAVASGTSNVGYTQYPDAAVLSGSGASAFTITQPASGTSDTSITVTFNPTTAGTFRAKVSIFSNDPNNPTYTINLEGEGVTTNVGASANESLGGDSELQGNVEFGDFQLLAASFGSSAGWDGGNFTYGSVESFGDFQLQAQSFGSPSDLTPSELAFFNSFAAQFGNHLVPSASGTGFQLEPL